MYENKHIEYFFIPLETQRELSFSDPNFIEKFWYISKLSLQSDRNPVPKMQIVRWVFKLVLILSLYNLLISEAIAQTASQQELDQEQAPAAACSEADRVSLLGFKARILKDTTDILSSWTGRDCCGGGWEGVQCNPATGRVTGLTLQRPASSDKYSALYMKGTLSPSLGSLQFLEVMVISGMKHIAGTIPQSFSNLTGLTLLVMEDNSLQGDIPSSLGHLPLLRILSLSGNRLIGQIPPSLGNLRNLIQLNLARNSLTGAIPPSSKNFLSLQSLDLSYNLLSGLIPAFIGQYRNLSFLDLSNNQLSGQIPNLLCELANLLDLSLSHNQLTGTIPDQIGNVKSLTTLSLSFNKLSGQIPESISRLQNLWYLNLSSNRLSNPLPTTLSKGIPSLLSIDLSYNSLNLGTIPEWIRSRQLSDVHLAGCNLKGTLPNFTKPDSLISVDLSDNYFTDGISNFFVKMSSLQKVKLSNNQLKSDLSGIAILPDGLSSLDLCSNQLSGSLSGVLNNKTSSFLEAIDVSSNQISGSIPEFNGGLSLKIFNIGSNKITGHIPSSISNLIQLERFDISRNQITGTIPTSLGLLVKMQWLDLSINGLTGRIPESLLGIENLRHANFRANRLCGEIPQGRPYNIFPVAAYAHNMCLCGKPLPPCKRNTEGITGQ